MKKKLLIASIIASLMIVSMGIGAFAATKLTLIVNGKTSNAETKIIGGVTYLPLRAVAELLGATVDYDPNSKTVRVTGQSSGSQGGSTAVQPNNKSQTIKGVTITLDRAEQDDDSLRLYVTYTNNSDDQAMTGDSLSKIVANGKQYEYDFDTNWDRYYNKDVDKAPDFIEPGVTAKSVIFFPPVPNVNNINVVLNADFEDYRFNNVKVDVLK
ncbi:hypothetical protein PA598K_01475 [Paenibacillus sp. 598K]|uniref:stalk domain-containing protein n=1 Tax=Paenibacillus sp. 598K TaxID=1117987 RepID=UPI000FFADCC9|nr:stalk domain-containing protein [Paenibacillus sp. 598K]GBF73190.1 hypothetical protein PA598K_01475 [Paenibacillus sp. 598K]